MQTKLLLQNDAVQLIGADFFCQASRFDAPAVNIWIFEGKVEI